MLTVNALIFGLGYSIKQNLINYQFLRSGYELASYQLATKGNLLSLFILLFIIYNTKQSGTSNLYIIYIKSHVMRLHIWATQQTSYKQT